MAKLYVFGIGGTGSRVLRSLTMLLAAGVDMGNISKIVPVVIDPDMSNADLTRTNALMNKYSQIRKGLVFDGNNKFFKTELSKESIPNYTLRLSNTDNQKFNQFIGLATMSKENQAMARMLFSEKNLEASMEVGFKGNPNIGSVVLNQIVDSPDFTEIANSFEAGDKIFIISSIFGGTGASGFPLLLKTLRTNKQVPKHNLLNQAEIGAVTVLPYFNVSQDADSEIDSSTFISKAKSALAYYGNTVAKLNPAKNRAEVDALYYLADDVETQYENCEGGVGQENKAHLVELLAATAIVDFAINDYTNQFANKELGIKDIVEADGSVNFNSFYSQMDYILKRPLSKLMLTANTLLDQAAFLNSSSFAANSIFTTSFYSSPFYRNLVEFSSSYKEWLSELKSNSRSLNLFNLECGDKPFDLLTGIKPKKIWTRLSDYEIVFDRLNSVSRSLNSKSKEDKFLEMFYEGTGCCLKDKFNI